MPHNLSADSRNTYLKDEYLFLQSQYEDYDKRSLTIKGWVSTGSAAALALAFNAAYKAGVYIPIMLAVIVSVIWYLEAYWKLFQYALGDRIRIIEAYFRNDPDIMFKDPEPFQIYNWWFKSYSKDLPIYPYEKEFRPKARSVRLRQAAMQKFVCLPYIPILILCVVTVAILARGSN
jgi:hypothetical protein